MPTVEIELRAIQPAIDLEIRRSGLQPEDLIDDTAGAGVTDKAWSADKLTGELSGIGVATLISGNRYRLGL